jgi:tripartite-type tricarboxylate transporter receptor subunit TctC
VKSWDELKHRKEFIVGSTSKGSADYIDAATLREVFGAPIKHVLGFPGAADQRLAIERGELDGDCSGFSTIPTEWLRDDKAHPFVRFTKGKGPGMPESARFIGDFATTQDQKDLLDALDAGNEVGRPFVMSGDVPADRIAIIRSAFDDTMKDPGYVAEAAKEQLTIDPLNGEKAAQVAADITTVSPAVIAEAKKIFE